MQATEVLNEILAECTTVTPKFVDKVVTVGEKTDLAKTPVTITIRLHCGIAETDNRFIAARTAVSEARPTGFRPLSSECLFPTAVQGLLCWVPRHLP